MHKQITAAFLAATAAGSKRTWIDRCDYTAVPACEDPTSSLRTYSNYSLCMTTIGCYQQIDYLYKDLINLGETITGVNGGNPFANLGQTITGVNGGNPFANLNEILVDFVDEDCYECTYRGRCSIYDRSCPEDGLAACPLEKPTYTTCPTKYYSGGKERLGYASVCC